MVQDRYISTPEAAKLFGLDRRYCAKLAKEAKRSSSHFPVRRGKSWEAPLSEWSKILKPKNKTLRKKRKERTLEVKESNLQQYEAVSCARAAAHFGISRSWAAKLANRAVKKGYTRPRKEGNQWIALLDEWEVVFQDPDLRAWKKEK